MFIDIPRRLAQAMLPCVVLIALLATTAGVWGAAGNAWHYPWEIQPGGISSMRQPTFAYYASSPLVLYTGNQFQGGGGTVGNQLPEASAVLYRIAGTTGWTELPLQYHSQSGNNRYYTVAIPPGTAQPGQSIEYYFRIAYSDQDTTFVHASGASWSAVTLNESTARANLFSIKVQPTPPPAFPSPSDWRDVNIYQIFTDRFNDGDPSNNNLSPSSFTPNHGQRVHGGDFRGIEQKLDYIKALGANAIWISPIVLNVGHGAYHGYAAHDFYQISPHWGTLADLQSMVASAHERGIYVILDIVAGHTGNRIGSTNPAWGSTFSQAGYPIQWNNTNQQYPPPFDKLDHFHNHGAIAGNWFDPHQVLGEFPGGLDDLKTESEYVRVRMAEIYSYWIEQANLDGFRLDTVKHIDTGFWQSFNPAIRQHAASIGKTNFFQFGEVYDGSDTKLGSYTGTKAGGAYANDSVLDFALYYKVNDVFARATGNTRQIEDRYNAIAANYHADAQMRLVTFLDNHDVTRFMNSANANNNTNRLHVATSFLYSSRGIPCLYYGTEQNFNGGTDPNNREDMFAGQFPTSGPSVGDKFNMTEPTFKHVSMLNNFRRLYPSLRRGTHVNRWNNSGGPGLFAYARVLNGEEVFVVFNTSGSAQSLTARPTSYPAGTVLVNLFNTNETVTVVSGTNGIPSITVPGTSTKMFIASSLLKPLDPVVSQQTPVHASSAVVPSLPVVIEFSKPMNPASVEGAFSITPASAGSFSWSPDHRTMTFSPPPGGFAGMQRYAVRIGTTAADSQDGKTMHGPFETFFTTGQNSIVDVIPPTVLVTQPSSGANVSGIIPVTGTAADNMGLDRVEVRLDFGNWTAASGTASWSYSLDTRLARNGSHTLGVRAFDASGNASQQVNVPLWFFNVPASYERRISAGNPSSVTDCEGKVWVADQAYTTGSFGYIGGSAGNIANTITGICAQAQPLYQRERYGANVTSFSYRFDCPPGVYEVTILQAENWVSGPNLRLFDVRIQNETVEANFDIFTLAGGSARPLQTVYTVTVDSGQLDIEFVPKVENTRVAGIHVRKVGDLDSSGDGIPDWWMYGYFDHAIGNENDRSRAEDDSDGDGVPNLHEYIAGTSPLDTLSRLRLGIESEPDVRLKIETLPGRRYWIYFSDELAGSDWQLLGGPIPGDGTIKFVSDPADVPIRFYRLGVDLAP
ncbi:MAG: Ig-like domain-containing protein [Chthoniobacterales bacterium]|nr:Ig-like domain-containing protein [Chthoniobacterales bacterium]